MRVLSSTEKAGLVALEGNSSLLTGWMGSVFEVNFIISTAKSYQEQTPSFEKLYIWFSAFSI